MDNTFNTTVCYADAAVLLSGLEDKLQRHTFNTTAKQHDNKH